VAAYHALEARNIHITAVNVFTFGAHARRSRLIFSKVFRRAAPIGVISWVPDDEKNGPWWQSSDRSENIIKETAGYIFEALFNSGRTSNSPN
jgi:hypothetical protein